MHFEAPNRTILESELRGLTNLKTTLMRAAITHLCFVTIHPLDDSNGRITHLLTDLALAQAEQQQSVRFYAMSVGILAKRHSYYEVLEQTQKGDLDTTA